MVVVNDASSVHNIVWIQWLTTGYVAVDIAPGDSSAPIHLNPFTTYYVMVTASCGQCYYATITTGDDGTTFWLYVYDPS
jgi:hypothetical protein